MSDVHLGKRDWKQLRKAKLFVVPAISAANYDDKLKKADLVKHAVIGYALSIRISSDLCDAIPVTHEKAEAALLAYNSYAKSKPELSLKKLSRDRDIVGSVLRPLAALRSDSADLFSAGNVELIERLSGLEAVTLSNVKHKGRLNAHAAERIARAAMSARLFAEMSKETISTFEQRVELEAVMAWKESMAPGAASANLLVDAGARHELLTAFLAFAAGLDRASWRDPKTGDLATTRLRDFFTTDHRQFKGQLAQDDSNCYLLGEEDQIPASQDWSDWTRL